MNRLASTKQTSALLEEIARDAIAIRGLASAIETDDLSEPLAQAIKALAGRIGYLSDLGNQHLASPGVLGGAEYWLTTPGFVRDIKTNLLMAGH